jgi:hypothetical protein
LQAGIRVPTVPQQQGQEKKSKEIQIQVLLISLLIPKLKT